MSSILNRLYFKNYKAFSEADIEIKPLTILLGANSSGKSSILQLILALEQTINNKDTYSSPLKLNGHYVNLGEDINIIKDKKRLNTVSIEFDIEKNTFKHLYKRTFDSAFGREIVYSFGNIKLDNDSIKEIFKRRFSLIKSTPSRPSLSGTKYIKSNPDNHFVNKSNKPTNSSIDKNESSSSHVYKYLLPRNVKKTSKETPSSFIKRYMESVSQRYNYEYDQSLLTQIDNYRLLLLFDSLSHNGDKNNNINETYYKLRTNLTSNSVSEIEIIVGNYYKFLSLLEKLSSIKICYELYIQPRAKRLSIRRNYIKIDDTKEIGFDVSLPEIIVKNTIEEITIGNEKKETGITYSGLQIQPYMNSNLDVKFIHTLLSSAYQAIESFFKANKISYVGPLRAFPQRYYFIDESNSSHSYNAQSGQRLAEILKRDKVLGNKINKWLKEFEINISVNEFKDIIHNIKITHNGLKLDITDVGFGYSQILPILVQAFRSEKDSLTIIEQPEIHLHPKMQAALADLFIEIVSPSPKNRRNIKASQSPKEKNLLIETHSEYMLKRLRRRIAEGKISSNDVAIYFIESRNNTNKDSAILKRVNVSEMGDIDWPKDFYITSLDDDIAFLEKKLQKSYE